MTRSSYHRSRHTITFRHHTLFRFHCRESKNNRPLDIHHCQQSGKMCSKNDAWRCRVHACLARQIRCLGRCWHLGTAFIILHLKPIIAAHQLPAGYSFAPLFARSFRHPGRSRTEHRTCIPNSVDRIDILISKKPRRLRPSSESKDPTRNICPCLRDIMCRC